MFSQNKLKLMQNDHYTFSFKYVICQKSDKCQNQTDYKITKTELKLNQS